MRAEHAFDVCHDAYMGMLSLHGWRIPSMTPNGDDAVRSDDGGRPHFLPTPGDYLADFARCGTRVLAPSRRVLFEQHYLAGADWDFVRKVLGLSPQGWIRWTDEIRQDVGRELLRTKVFDPKRYFKEPIGRCA